MKKLLALVIAAALCAGLCGCASTVSVSGAQIDADGHLILSMSDGSTLDAGLARGEKGEKGDKGDRGEQGIQGLPGEKGEKGDKGDRGPRGEKGERGAQGIQGERGAAGYSGGSGASGRDGVDGKNGRDGMDGKTPYIGKNGHWWIGDDDTGVPATVSPGTRVTSAEDIKKAIGQTNEGDTAEVSLMNDLILSEPLKITADTVIHGNGYKVKLDSDINNPIFDGGEKSLTLDNMTLDGQNKRVSNYFGAINGGKDSSLTLSNVTIENVDAERIIRAVSVQSVNLTNVTIRNNTTSNSKDGAYGLLFTNVENMTLKNVSITDNNIGKSLILIWGNDKVNALAAEGLTIENNTIGEHILATSGTNCSDTITLTSGSIRGNNTAGIYMVGNLTIGKDMNVQCGITLNNDSAKGVCTLTNNGTIAGDITSADWAVKERGLPVYTGTGTHTGTKTNITDLTAPVQP